MDSEMRLAREKSVSEITIPILFIEAKDDEVVDNEEIKTCSKKASNPANRYTVLAGDHTSCFFNKENYWRIFDESIGFLDGILYC
jgi:poly(3-hydroxyalkanoate) synthetase